MAKELKKMTTTELIEEIDQARGKSGKLLSKDRLSQIMAEITVVRKAQDALSNDLLGFALWHMLPNAPESDYDTDNFLQREVAKYFIDKNPDIFSGHYYESLDESRSLAIFQMAIQCPSHPQSNSVSLGTLAEMFLRFDDQLMNVPSENLYSFIRQMMPSQRDENFRDVAFGVIAVLVGDPSYIYA